jgi:hypothetical protein
MMKTQGNEGTRARSGMTPFDDLEETGGSDRPKSVSAMAQAIRLTDGGGQDIFVQSRTARRTRDLATPRVHHLGT